MRRVLVIALALLVTAPVSSVFAAGGGAPGTASITGSTKGAAAKAANVSVRLRNVADGKIAGSTGVDAAGKFSFTGLQPGNYVVELVNAAGTVMTASAPVALAEGAAVTIGALSTAGAVAAATASAGTFFGSTAGIVSLAAAGAAVGAVTVATRTQASGSQ